MYKVQITLRHKFSRTPVEAGRIGEAVECDGDDGKGEEQLHFYCIFVVCVVFCN